MTGFYDLNWCKEKLERRSKMIYVFKMLNFIKSCALVRKQ